MKGIIKMTSAVTSVLLALTSLCGCTNSGKGAPDSIKIGGIGPLTGAAAIYGTAVKKGAEIAVQEINAKDGLKLSLRFEDDENDPEKAINAYNRLKDWGMQVSMGTVTTTPCIAVSAETNRDKMFALTPAASSTDVIGGQPNKNGTVSFPRKEHVFQMCFTDPNQGVASAQYIKEQNLGTRIAVIYNNSDAYSTGIFQKFMSEARELQLNVVSVQTFTDDSANDFTSQLGDAKNKGADLMFLPIYYTPASLIFSQAKKLQFSPRFFGVDGLDGILTLDNFDKSLAEGVMLLTPFTPDGEDEQTKAFVEAYQKRYNEAPNQFAADGYDTVMALYKAMTETGVTYDMRHKEICDRLTRRFTDKEHFRIDGLTGIGMTWSETGEVSKEPKGMVIENGVYVGM